MQNLKTIETLSCTNPHCGAKTGLGGESALLPQTHRVGYGSSSQAQGQIGVMECCRAVV